MSTSFVTSLVRSDSAMLAFSNLSRSLCYLVPVPILYMFRTPADVSVWLVITTLLSIQNLFFLGVPHVMVRMLSYADSTHPDTRGAEQDLSLADLAQFTKISFAVFSAFVVVLLASLGSAALVLPINHMTLPLDGWLAWAAIVLASPLRVLLLRQITYLNGRGKIADARRIDGLAWFIGGLVATGSVLLVPSLALMAIILHLSAAAAAVSIGRLCKANSWDSLSSGLDWQQLRRTLALTWPPIWRSGLGALLNAGSRQGIGLIFAQSASPEASAGYLLAQQAVAVLTMLSSAPVFSRLHKMTYAFRQKDNAGVIREAAQATRQSLWIAAGLAALIGLAIPFVKLVPQFETSFVSLELWVVLAITLLFQRNAGAHLQTYSVTNVIVWHWLDGATGAISVLGAFLLIPVFGIWGAALAGLIGILSVYAWVPMVLNHRQYHIPFPDFEVRTALAPLTLFAVLILLAAAISRALA